ncbi:hypothetical protein EAX62_12125 [Tessaracoccus antarcticus]|uniref:Uncharacterized protein n=1 Tax=Tessaracoccus antarcticus TaxID=2479848 RepID=A0A3M0G1K7_9ACTN|nr:hypothetical protein EAX62_12125 [Tessaracoccus antarcticus]
MNLLGQALGRLPWLALFLRRALRLRPRLPMVTPRLLDGAGTSVPETGAGSYHASHVALGAAVVAQYGHGSDTSGEVDRRAVARRVCGAVAPAR